MNGMRKPKTLLGTCQDELLIIDIFGSVSEFARVVEERGIDFVYGSGNRCIYVTYNSKTAIHSFWQSPR